MIKRNIIANYLGQSWSSLLGLLFAPFYIYYLGIEAYGLIGLYTVLQAWFVLLDAGMTPMLGREMARFSSGAHTPQSIRDLLYSLEIIIYGIAILILFIVWLSSDWLASDWLKTEMISTNEIARALTIIALIIGLRFCEGIYRSAIINLQKQVWLNTASATLQTIQNVGALCVLAFVSSTIEAFFLWQMLISVITLITLATKSHKLIPLAPIPARFSINELRKVWRFAGGMLGINILAVMLAQIDKVILSNLLSLKNFGYYMLASRIASVLFMGIAPIIQAFYPRFVQLFSNNNKKEFAFKFHQSAQMVTLVTLAPMLIIVFFASDVLYAWTGDLTLASQTAPILALLILGNFFNGLMRVPYQSQLAAGITSFSIKMNIIAVVILVPAIIILVPIYGAVAAAWIWLILNMGYVTIAAHFMYNNILDGEKWFWYMNDLIKPIFFGLLPVFFFFLFSEQSYKSDRVVLFISFLFLGMICFIVTLISSSYLWPKAKYFIFKRFGV